jgi:hypothetical protein
LTQISGTYTNPLLREDPEPPLALSPTQAQGDQKLRSAMIIFTGVALHEPPVYVLPVGLVVRPQVFLDGNSGEGSHRLSVVLSFPPRQPSALAAPTACASKMAVFPAHLADSVAVDIERAWFSCLRQTSVCYT